MFWAPRIARYPAAKHVLKVIVKLGAPELPHIARVLHMHRGAPVYFSLKLGTPNLPRKARQYVRERAQLRDFHMQARKVPHIARYPLYVHALAFRRLLIY